MNKPEKPKEKAAEEPKRQPVPDWVAKTNPATDLERIASEDQR